MTEVTIQRNDVLKAIYFILSIAQAQKGNSMHGALSSKGDLIGGIFDRWINVIPESIIFNKILFPLIKENNDVEIISDFYSYDPREAGIAPDVIGIKVNHKTVPFAKFNKKWAPVDNMPQIEIKTFKKPQKMISLRNQGYDDEYLVMAETDFRIDYLLPFFSNDVTSDHIYNDMSMDDSAFIENDENNVLHHFSKLNTSDDTLGMVNLLKITKAIEFMNFATHCEDRVSVQYINNIETVQKTKRSFDKEEKLKDYCTINSYNIYSFNNQWYDGIDNNIPFINKGSNKFYQRTLDFYTDKIDAISITKRNKSTLYIEVSEKCIFNDMVLIPEMRYKISFATLERNDNPNDEYFIQKSLTPYIPCFEEELSNKFKTIINENKE